MLIHKSGSLKFGVSMLDFSIGCERRPDCDSRAATQGKDLERESSGVGEMGIDRVWFLSQWGTKVLLLTLN
jgi:hypothetical protein